MRKLLVVLVVLSLLACKKEELAPTSIRITKITVTNFPPTDTNGAGWDILDGPDIYVEIRLDNQTIYKHNQFFEDAIPNNNYEFIPNTNINLDRPNNEYRIGLLDFDDNITQDDVLGYIPFIPYQPNVGTPATATLSAPGTDVEFIFDLEYTF